jgi:hypothetical protein
MVVQPEIVAAIMAIFGIGVIGIIQTIKNLLHLEGTGAYILTAVVSFGATAAYLFQAHIFTVLGLIIYGAIVFGEASGLYKVLNGSA